MSLVKYRIVKDGYCGYECQKWRIWFPFWVQMGVVNTHFTIEDAKNYINGPVVVWSSNKDIK